MKGREENMKEIVEREKRTWRRQLKGREENMKETVEKGEKRI